jgi:hypothetical protein
MAVDTFIMPHKSYIFMKNYVSSCSLDRFPAVALNVYATSFLNLREEHGLRVFQNRVLRGILVPKWEGVAEDWRKEHN